MLAARVYIQFSERRLKLSSPQIPDAFECSPFMAIETIGGKKIIAAVGREAEVRRGQPHTRVINPFSDPDRTLGDFIVAEKLLLHAVRSFLTWRWRLLPPIAIIHPERRIVGGVSAVEQRALIELCKAAGFRKTAVHEGRPLTLDEVQKYEVA